MDAGAEAAFEIAAVSPDGARIGLPARLRLLRERPDWRLVMHGSLARYETVWRDEPLETQQIAIPAGEPLRYAKRLDFGRYRLEITEANGLAATSIRFRAGWVASENPGRAGSGGRLRRPRGPRARRDCAHPHRPALRRRGDPPRAHRPGAPVAHAFRPRGRDGCGGAGRRGLGAGAYVAVHIYRAAADPKPAGPAGRSDSPGSASIRRAASSRWRSRRRRNIRHARKPLFRCAPRLAPGSALRRWMRASFG